MGRGAGKKKYTFARVAREVIAARHGDISPRAYWNLQFYLIKKLNPFFGRMDIDKITINTIRRYLKGAREYRSCHNDIGYIRCVLRFAWLEGYTTRLIQFRNKETESDPGRYVFKHEINKLLRECKNDELRLQILLGYTSGMRKSEICHCRKEWIVRERGAWVIKLPAWFLKTRKMTGRTVPIHPMAMKYVRPKLKHESPFLFPSPYKPGRHINNNNMAWQRLRVRASRKHPTLANIRFHDLRHSCCSNLAIKTAPTTIQTICGLAPRTLRRYTRPPADILQKCIVSGYKQGA